MPDQDSKVRCNITCLKTALLWLFSYIDWSPIKFRKDCTWSPRMLAAAAMFWALADESTLGERFQSVRKITAFLFAKQQQPAKSYQSIAQHSVFEIRNLFTARPQNLYVRQPVQAAEDVSWRFGKSPVFLYRIRSTARGR